MKELLHLAWTFVKIGAISFGGGYAMLPHIQRELVDRRGWVTREEVLDYFAIGQSTPGIIAINVSSFVGYKRRGVPGAFASTFGFVLPSLVIISVIAGVLGAVSSHPLAQHAFAGIRVAVGALILDVVIRFIKGAVKDVPGALIALAALLASLIFSASPVLVVVLAGLMGWLIYRPWKKQAAGGEEQQ